MTTKNNTTKININQERFYRKSTKSHLILNNELEEIIIGLLLLYLKEEIKN